ncbi:hypothetical protein AGABI2DRAFT_179868, partial [Agaricus bisporus var. bisporus H97]|uniref:hypothetical protein n=1 Tax=Agaricus bisporus var. bisporus (strain H97 / ATCC MYA-4626 / FGSC 10389) TaxID=936046 RepID=UPI00029F7988
MTSITTDPSHGRFSRHGFTFGLKSQSESRERARNSQRDRDEDWYIPYTGPYEPPPEPRSSRTRDRDSWGDPIYAGEAGGGGAPRVHYDDGSGDRGYSSRASEESRIRGRERARSVSSSSTVPGRPSDVSQRRNMTSCPRQPALSYITPEVGGVGESPVPYLRQSKDRPASPRASLASIFTFGVRPPTSPARADRAAKLPARKLPYRPNTSSAGDNRLSTVEHRRTMSGGTTSQSIGSRHASGDPMQSLYSQTTDEDYYNSYYSTLVNNPTKILGTDSINPYRNDPLSQSSPASQHPYVFVSQSADESQPSSANPQSAPPSSGSYDIQPIIPKLAFSETPSNHPNTTSTPPNSSSNGTLRKLIKGSVSTPNLQQAANANVRLGTIRRIPKGIERWLSAETWCDALLFPRPRLRLQNEAGLGRRTLSPPGSAVVPTGSGTTQATQSVPSRVLAHSRSLVNLGDPQRGPKPGSSLNAPQTRLHTFTERAEEAAANKPLRPPRPRSWSSDDLDLPTPVPSLARVLAEGERLDSERKEWQSRAAHSLGNKQARSVSRSRSKSLTANGRKANTQGKGNMNYLAARAVHGNQDIIPLVPSISIKQGKLPSQQGSMSRSSQSQTNTSSPGRSRTHSSRSHSRDHSRNDSWSKSALKAVQSVPCCDTEATKTPIIENVVPRQKEASRMLRNDVLAHRVADPSFVVDPSTTLPVPAIVPSPTPSNVSGLTDPRVGIAISTPLPAEPLDRDNLRLPSHPYAQGGFYSAPVHPSNEQSAGYAGRHPVTSATQPAEFSDFPAARHKLPPQAPLPHPYAQASPSVDSYDDNLVKYVLADSSVSPASKTWGTSRSGAAREPLLREMKYSRYIDEDGNLTGVADTAGVGEILAYAVEQQMEGESSAKGGLRSAAGMQNVRKEADDSTGRLGPRSRIPVQYDVTRQVPPQNLQKSPDTPHTFASSSLEHRFTPKIPQFVKAEMEKNLNVPGAGSTEFSQNLPVPEAGSGESSQRNSPRPLGSPNDLVGFQDLFYKPGVGSLRQRIVQKSSSRLSSPDSQSSLRQLSNIPFDLKSPNPRRTSGLTTLARKLSEEYEQLSHKERTSSQHSLSSDSVVMGSPRSPLIQKPTEGSLEFVFEEPRSAELSPDGQPINEQRLGFQSFRHQDNIPEDIVSVSSTGTGKEVEASEDETERIHVGNVEALTPAEVASDHRLSYTGQMDKVDISPPLSQNNPSQSVTFERF